MGPPPSLIVGSFPDLLLYQKFPLPLNPNISAPLFLALPRKGFHNNPPISPPPLLPRSSRKPTCLHPWLSNTGWLHLFATPCTSQSRIQPAINCHQSRCRLAFDHLSHSAIATFLSTCGPHLESYILLRIIVLSRVLLSISDTSWEQKLLRGIVQGSSYSAEIFARPVDSFLGHLVSLWSKTESTWIQSTDPGGAHRHLFNLLFADDIILLATSYEQAARLLEQVMDTLASIGLSLALDKCQFIVSPDLGIRPLVVRDVSVKRVPSFLFLGVLVGFGVSCQAVLWARLSSTQDSFWGYLKILKRPGSPIKTRLHLLDTYITSKWRWMSPCFRPTTNIQNMLKVMQTAMLTTICGLASDPFVTQASNWVTRRRGSKIIAQAVNHKNWKGLHAQAFLAYWGHASRIFQFRSSPITTALHIRDGSWLQALGDRIRRNLGFWPNCYRFIQLAYESLRTPSEPTFWEDKAQNRSAWTEFVSSWLSFKKLQVNPFYDSLTEVDLGGRCLLQIGDSFKLLPFRHVPVEQPYGTSFEIIPERLILQDCACFQICSDGGCKAGVGSAAATVLSPYAPLEQAIIFQQKLPAPCTNNKAELLAAVKAFQMIRTLLRYYPHIPFMFMTDSMLVIQIIEEFAQVSCHPHTIHELRHLWREICRFGKALHVKGHSGHPQNTLTDRAATQALQFEQYSQVFRNFDYSKACFTQSNQNPPPFQKWL